MRSKTKVVVRTDDPDRSVYLGSIASSLSHGSIAARLDRYRGLDRSKGIKKKSDKRSALDLRKLEDRLDVLARKACHERGVCELAGDGIPCGTKPGRRRLEWAHVLGRDDKSLRHLPLDCLCACPVHHDHYDANPASLWYLIARRWPDRMDRLHELSRTLMGGGLATAARYGELAAFYETGVVPSFLTVRDLFPKVWRGSAPTEGS